MKNVRSTLGRISGVSDGLYSHEQRVIDFKYNRAKLTFWYSPVTAKGMAQMSATRN
jgi:hypothetical protein